MLDPIIQFFERLVTQFTWGRLLLLIVTLCISFTVLMGYESYTGQFRLGRIDRATALLAKLTDISPKVKETGDSGLIRIQKALIADLGDYLTGHNSPFSMNRTLLKTLASVLPWILLTTLIFVGSDTGGNRNAVIGMIVFAVPMIAIGAYLPDFEHPWINFIGYPFGSIALVVIAVTIWSNKQKRAKTSRGLN